MQHRQRVVKQVLHSQPQPVQVALRCRRQVGTTPVLAAIQHPLLALRLFVAYPHWEASCAPIKKVQASQCRNYLRR